MKQARLRRSSGRGFIVLLALATCAGLALHGFGWGLPSARRNALYFAGGFDPARLPEMTPADIAHAWDAYPNIAGNVERKGAYPRSAFNPLRSYHPDEYVLLKSLAQMGQRREPFPGFFAWPAAYFYAVGAALGAAHELGVVTLRRDLAFYFEHPDALARMYLAGRTVTLLFALGTLLFLWRATRRLYGRRGGVAALWLLAVTPMFVANSRYMTADIAALFWTSAAFYASVRLLRDRRWRWWLLAGAAVGLAAATRYKDGLAAFAVAAAFLVGRPERDGSRWTRDLPRATLAALVAALVFFALNPYILLRWGAFVAELRAEAASATGEIVPWPRLLLGYPIAGLTAPLAALALGGIAVAAWRRRRHDLFLLLAFMPALLLLAAGRPTMLRYFLPVLPLAPVAAARAWLALRAGRRASRAQPPSAVASRPASMARLFAAALMGAVALYAFCVTLAWANVYAGVDPRTRAGEWIAKNIPAGETIGVVEIPWQFDTPPLDDRRYRIEVTGQDPARLRRLDPDAMTFSQFQFPPLALRGPLDASEREFWAVLGALGQTVAGERFGAGRVVFRRPAHLLGFETLVAPASRWPIHDLRYPNPDVWVVRGQKERPTP